MEKGTPSGGHRIRQNGEEGKGSVILLSVKEACSVGEVKRMNKRGFPGGAVVKNTPAKAGDMGSIPGPGRSHMSRSN